MKNWIPLSSRLIERILDMSPIFCRYFCLNEDIEPVGVKPQQQLVSNVCNVKEEITKNKKGKKEPCQKFQDKKGKKK